VITNTGGGGSGASGLSPLPAPAVTNLTLQLAGGTDPTASLSLNLDAFQFGFHNSATIGSATGGAGAGKASFDALDVSTALSDASPELFAALASGRHYETATLTETNAAGQPIASWVLGTVFVTDDLLTDNGFDPPAEELKFAFGAITEVTNPNQASWSIIAQTATGPAGPNPSTLAPLAPYSPTITVSAGPFTYDGNSHAASATAAGITGDALSGSFTFTYYAGTAVSGTGFDTAPTLAGAYTVVAHFSSTDPNYASADSTPLTFRIAQAPLTIAANSTSKTYGQTVTFAGTEFTTSGLVSGDTVTSVTLRSDGAAAGAGVVGSPYAIVASAAVGTGLSNYIITYVSGQLTVNPALLTITANDATMIQGEAFPSFTVRYNGFVNNEGPGVLGGTLLFSTTATAGSPPGTYDITPSGLTSSNYDITFVKGTLTVLSSSQATTNLQTQVDAAGLDHGTQNSLDSQLQAVLASLAAGNTNAAANQLKAFINHVSAQSGKHIDAALADALIAYARRIINALG
jgi:hypothetical protein